MNFKEAILKRRSVRTFDFKNDLTPELLADINNFLKNANNPYNIDIEWKIFEASKYKLSSPVINGEKYYIIGKVKKMDHALEAFGYEFEEIILYLTSIGVGTTWMAGTLDRKIFEKAIDLKEDEVMPCVTPIGYPNNKMSLKEKLMRKGIKADHRKDFNELFFSKNFNNPLDNDELNKYKDILELVRKAPSAVNKQPWRILINNNIIHFYKNSKKGYSNNGLDIQKVDLGIAIDHFVIGLKDKNIQYEFLINDPKIECDFEYIASILIK